MNLSLFSDGELIEACELARQYFESTLTPESFNLFDTLFMEKLDRVIF